MLPRGDVVAMCDYCGVNWYRSQLYRDASGFLVCPDEGPGLDAVTLDQENAAYRPRGPVTYPDGGNYVTAPPGTPPQIPPDPGPPHSEQAIPSLLERLSTANLGGAYSIARRLDDRVDLGPAVVKNMTTAETASIPFTEDGELDVDALANLCSGADGRVQTLHDLSGGGLHYAANNDGPKIWDASAGLVTNNGKPSMEFGAPDELTRSDALGLSGNVGLDVFTVGRSDPGFMWQLGPSVSGQRVVMHVLSSSGVRVNYANGNQDFDTLGNDPTAELLSHHVRSPAGASYDDNRWWINNEELPTTGSVDGVLSMSDSLSFLGNGPSRISEWLVFGTPSGFALSEAGAAAVRADQKSYYGT